MNIPRRIRTAGTKRLAVFRNGRFIKAGNTAWLWNDSDAIKEFDTKSEPKSFRLASVYINGVELNLTIGLSCAFDPITTLSRDPQKMAEAFEQRHQQTHDGLEAEVRRILERQIQHMVSQQDLPINATIGQRILPILEGSATRSLLIKSLEIAMDRSLPDLGYRLNREFPLTFTELDLSPIMVDADNPKRTFELIHRHLPALSTAMLEGLLTSLRTGGIVDWQDMIMEGDAAIGWHATSGTDEQERVASTLTSSNPPADYYLSKSDLSVLKKVPEEG